ncbi:SulP family inorganic anion transporter [Motiliproteus sp. MSK22-1]|uniref:SulP family inorganic anion transporter n=1 Tax=Motiliproteus sp. MSK22-1 TaxID=1897630 RepID=UPI000976FBA1|nr:sodium-independent anion transporter [Motiliproteus sp. MSK22-1]
MISKAISNHWLLNYQSKDGPADLMAAVIVTIMLIPQSLAYALLAGLPPQAGLYASILPLGAYALFGSSRFLAVGPVAVVSLMTAAAVSQIAIPGTAEYWGASLVLAAASGLILLLMAILRLGWIANYLSHPVISGFITASAILIAVSQLKHLLGIQAQGHNLIDLGTDIFQNLETTNTYTLLLGTASLGVLFWTRKGLKTFLMTLQSPALLTDLLTKAGPVLVVVTTTLAVLFADLETKGVQIVGHIPQGLPALTLPNLNLQLWKELLPAAILISLIGFVESISVAQTLAAKRRQRITPDKELLGLGSANLASAISGGFPVTGGFSRSVVNFDAGARTPLAGILTAAAIALAAILLTPWFYHLPKATLAATIIVAVVALIDLSALKRTWNYSRADFTAMAATILTVLLVGVEAGVITGVLLSILLFLRQTSKPHVAEVGLVPGTEHFRNVDRHRVETLETVINVRVDESLYFANTRFLEDLIYDKVLQQPQTKDVVLVCAAINHIDASALESLEELTRRLFDAGVQLHLSEVKGPVMDRLKQSAFLDNLTGKVFLSQFQAWQALKLKSENDRLPDNINSTAG